MRTTVHCWRGALLTAIFAIGATRLLPAQETRTPPSPRAEVAVTYEYLKSNTLPAGCGCFGLNGGSAEFAWRPRPSHFAGVFDAGIVRASGITSSNYTLTLGIFLAGVRYLPYLPSHRSQPFAQAAIGGAHSSGTLVQGYGTTAVSPSAAFAGSIGGGLDVRMGQHFAVRALEADYLATTFSNGVNNRQNNLRLSAGIVLHF